MRCTFPFREKETRILDNATGDGSDAQGNSWIDFSAVTAVLRVIDTVTVFYFFLEYVVRFLCSPLKRRFFFQVCLETSHRNTATP